MRERIREGGGISVRGRLERRGWDAVQSVEGG